MQFLDFTGMKRKLFSTALRLYSRACTTADTLPKAKQSPASMSLMQQPESRVNSNRYDEFLKSRKTARVPHEAAMFASNIISIQTRTGCISATRDKRPS